MADDLTCKELVELVTDYLEDRMSRNARLRFERHLNDCEGCTTYLEQMRQTVSLLGRLTEEDIQPERRQHLLALFRDWKQASSVSSR